MTTGNMAFTEGAYLLDPSQEAYPPPYEPTGSGNFPLKHLTLTEPGYYVLIAKAVVRNYTNAIVVPEFNIFTNDPYKIIDFSEVSLLPFYPPTPGLSSTVAYSPDVKSVTVMGWIHVTTKSETIYFGFGGGFDFVETQPKLSVYNYSLLAVLMDHFAYQEDHKQFVNGIAQA